MVDEAGLVVLFVPAECSSNCLVLSSEKGKNTKRRKNVAEKDHCAISTGAPNSWYA